MRNSSIWHATTGQVARTPLRGKHEFDIVIVGGGIAGISTAYELSYGGHRIALLEARTVLGDVTGHTTGKLTSQHGLIFAKTINRYGREKAYRYAEANQWAIQRVREVTEGLSIPCDLIEDTANIYLEHEGDADLEEEAAACRDIGLPASVQEVDLGFRTARALRFENQARFHPLKYCLGILEEAERKGVSVFENTRVLEVEEKNGGCQVVADDGEIQAGQVVIATHYPIHDSGLFVSRLFPYRAYAIAIEAERMPDGMYISNSSHHSFRRQPYAEGEALIVGGGHHKVGQHEDTEACYRETEDFARKAFGVRRVLHRWATQDNWTPDDLPYVGPSPRRDRIFLATGFCGWGMTNGVVAGKLLADCVNQMDNVWLDVYAPSRFDWTGLPSVTKESFDSAAHLIGDRVSPAEFDDPAAIPVGHGAVVQLKGERVCVYRESAEKAHVVTSACTHWGCQLHWNVAEKSWDCPCHGSRFGIDGQVLHGPAVRPLEQREWDEMRK